MSKKDLKTLEERVCENRRNLEKQNAWADSVAIRDFMENVEIKEIAYGDGPREKMDIIRPKKSLEEKLPILIYIHGGGWIAGTKESRRTYCGKFAEAGYCVFNIEYDLAPEARFPAAVGQCIRAVDYIMEHAKDYTGDTKRIVMAGESAGVYYAAFVSAISKDKSIPGKIGISDIKHQEFDVKANMFNCGVVDLKNMIEKGFPDVDLMAEAYTGHPAEEILSGRWDDEMKKIDPFNYISESYPPTFLLYGSLDSLRFNTFAMAGRLKELKVPYSLYKSTGIFYGQHTTTMILRSRKAFRVFDDISGWLREVLKKEDEIAAVGQDMIV